MFSPEASTLNARSSLRNPRRRPRNSDGAQQQQPRRKRSKLGDETFVSIADDKGNGNGSLVMNGHAGHGNVESSMVLVDMPVREKKAPAKRPLKDDMALYLVGVLFHGLHAHVLTGRFCRIRMTITASRSFLAFRQRSRADLVRFELLL